MPPRISSANPAVFRSTPALSARARPFPLFIATSVTSKPATLLSLRTCPPKFPATTSSCPKRSAEHWGKGIPSFSILSDFRQNTGSTSGGMHEPPRSSRDPLFCQPLARAPRQPCRRRRAAPVRLLCRVFSGGAPVGREAPRHPQHGQSPLLHAASLGAPAPCRLAL